MTAKFSQARKDAFLAALAETGNQTLAAERAKVSRSWVQLHRSSDPEFKRLSDEAIAAFDGGRGASNAPPTGWGFLDGVELVVRGTGGSGGGKRVQIARARLRQWSPRVEERFLETLAATCNVTAACAEVGLTPASAYAHRKRWRAFAKRWDEAVEIGYSRIECGLLEHACNLFSWDGPLELRPMPEMTAKEAIHLLDMHKHQVRGIGKAPGKRWKPPPRLDDPAVRGQILAVCERIERLRRAELAEEQRERDEEEWSRRRRSTSSG